MKASSDVPDPLLPAPVEPTAVVVVVVGAGVVVVGAGVLVVVVGALVVGAGAVTVIVLDTGVLAPLALMAVSDTV